MTATAKRRLDRWIPWTFVGGFAVVVAVNAVLVYFATATFTGIETEHHFERGLAYNQTIAAAEAEVVRGWRLEPAFESRGPRTGRLTVVFSGRDGAPMAGAEMSAHFVRPTQSGHDVEIPVADRGAGRYVADVELPLAGQWDLRVVARRQGEIQQARQRVFLAP